MLAPSILWMILSCITILFELGHPSLFFFLSLSFGSIIASAASAYSYSLVIQMALFLLGAVFSAIGCRFWLACTARPTVRTNMNALIGRTATVVADISFDQSGYIKVDGEKWLARSMHKKKLNVGVYVRIVDVRGAHAVVEKLKTV